MTSEDKRMAIGFIATAMVMIAFVGGCTVSVNGENKIGQMRSCIQAGMEWRDGDCVRPEARQ